MASDWRYRVSSVFGTVVISALAVAVAEVGPIQTLFGYAPMFGHLPFYPHWRSTLLLEVATVTFVVSVAMAPLYKPRPRRDVDVVRLTSKRTFIACISLAAIGYFNYSYRVPRATLIVVGAVLLVSLPAWFLFLSRRSNAGAERSVVIGDDPEAIDRAVTLLDSDVVGYVAPASVATRLGAPEPVAVPDGGHAPAYLGGFTRLDEHLVDNDIDTAVLAFSERNWSEFFDVLGTCHRRGVLVKTLRHHADEILVGTSVDQRGLVDVELQPWDWQDGVIKRCFDVGFATAALVLTLPLWILVPVAIKFEDGGPVFYRQERTAIFGDPITVSKFRTMQTGDAASDPEVDESDRVTSVGRYLRKTHIDELPQLFTILQGDMSVVGPRPAWRAEEQHLARAVDEWRKRWFVKPGLTGLAQIRGATSVEADEKIVHDLEYIRRQSVPMDVYIVCVQLWLVVADVIEVFRIDR